MSINGVLYKDGVDPMYEFFEYHNQLYATGTIVKFNQDYLEKFFVNDVINKSVNEQHFAKCNKKRYDEHHYVYGRASMPNYDKGIVNFVIGERESLNCLIDLSRIHIEMNMDDLDDAIAFIVEPHFPKNSIDIYRIGGPKNYFKYKGKVYTAGTVVKFKSQDGKKVKYGRFTSYSNYDLKRFSFEVSNNIKRNYKYGGLRTISEEELETQIQEIVIPREGMLGHTKPANKPSDWEIDGLMIGWAIYIAAMVFCAIFTQRFVGWTLGSVVFFSWRYQKIKEAGY